MSWENVTEIRARLLWLEGKQELDRIFSDLRSEETGGYLWKLSQQYDDIYRLLYTFIYGLQTGDETALGEARNKQTGISYLDMPDAQERFIELIKAKVVDWGVKAEKEWLKAIEIGEPEPAGWRPSEWLVEEQIRRRQGDLEVAVHWITDELMPALVGPKFRDYKVQMRNTVWSEFESSEVWRGYEEDLFETAEKQVVETGKALYLEWQIAKESGVKPITEADVEKFFERYGEQKWAKDMSKEGMAIVILSTIIDGFDWYHRVVSTSRKAYVEGIEIRVLGATEGEAREALSNMEAGLPDIPGGREYYETQRVFYDVYTAYQGYVDNSFYEGPLPKPLISPDWKARMPFYEQTVNLEPGKENFEEIVSAMKLEWDRQEWARLERDAAAKGQTQQLHYLINVQLNGIEDVYPGIREQVIAWGKDPWKGPLSRLPGGELVPYNGHPVGLELYKTAGRQIVQDRFSGVEAVIELMESNPDAPYEVGKEYVDALITSYGRAWEEDALRGTALISDVRVGQSIKKPLWNQFVAFLRNQIGRTHQSIEAFNTTVFEWYKDMVQEAFERADLVEKEGKEIATEDIPLTFYEIEKQVGTGEEDFMVPYSQMAETLLKLHSIGAKTPWNYEDRVRYEAVYERLLNKINEAQGGPIHIARTEETDRVYRAFRERMEEEYWFEDRPLAEWLGKDFNAQEIAWERTIWGNSADPEGAGLVNLAKRQNDPIAEIRLVTSQYIGAQISISETAKSQYLSWQSGLLAEAKARFNELIQVATTAAMTEEAYNETQARQAIQLKHSKLHTEIENLEAALSGQRLGGAILQAAKIQPFVNFKPLKSKAGFDVEEFSFNHLEQFFDNWADSRLEQGIEVSPKINGYRLILETKAGEPRIYMEGQTKDYSNIFTGIAEEIAQLPDVILDDELVEEVDGQIGVRENLGKYRGAAVDDINAVVYVFDVLYLDKEDLHDQPLRDRRKRREALFAGKEFKHLRLLPSWVVHTREELLARCQEADAFPASEGAMLKTLDSVYPVDRRTSEWAKLKRHTDIHAIVLGKSKTKGDDWVYRCGVLYQGQKDVSLLDIEKFNGRKYVILGNTFRTQLKAKPGEVLEVAVSEIGEHDTGAGYKYSWHLPTVKDKSERKVDTLEYTKQAGQMLSASPKQPWKMLTLIERDILMESTVAGVQRIKANLWGYFAEFNFARLMNFTWRLIELCRERLGQALEPFIGDLGVETIHEVKKNPLVTDRIVGEIEARLNGIKETVAKDPQKIIIELQGLLTIIRGVLRVTPEEKEDTVKALEERVLEQMEKIAPMRGKSYESIHRELADIELEADSLARAAPEPGVVEKKIELEDRLTALEFDAADPYFKEYVRNITEDLESIEMPTWSTSWLIDYLAQLDNSLEKAETQLDTKIIDKDLQYEILEAMPRTFVVFREDLTTWQWDLYEAEIKRLMQWHARVERRYKKLEELPKAWLKSAQIRQYEPISQERIDALFNQIKQEPFGYYGLTHSGKLLLDTQGFERKDPTPRAERMNRIKTALEAKAEQIKKALSKLEVDQHGLLYIQGLPIGNIKEAPQIKAAIEAIIDEVDAVLDKELRETHRRDYPGKDPHGLLLRPIPLGSLDLSGYPFAEQRLIWLEGTYNINPAYKGNIEEVLALLEQGKRVLIRVAGNPEDGTGVMTVVATEDGDESTGDVEAMKKLFVHRARAGLTQEPQAQHFLETFGDLAEQPDPFSIAIEKTADGLVGIGGCSGYFVGINNKGEYCFVTAAHCVKDVPRIGISTFYGDVMGDVIAVHQGPPAKRLDIDLGHIDAQGELQKPLPHAPRHLTWKTDVAIIAVDPRDLPWADRLVALPLADEEVPLGLSASFLHQEVELVEQAAPGYYHRIERGRPGDSGGPLLTTEGKVGGIISFGIGQYGEGVQMISRIFSADKLRDIYRAAGLTKQLGGALVEDVEEGAGITLPKMPYMSELHHKQGSGVNWALGVLQDAILDRYGGYWAGTPVWNIVDGYEEQHRQHFENLEIDLKAQNLLVQEIWGRLDAEAFQIGSSAHIPELEEWGNVLTQISQHPKWNELRQLLKGKGLSDAEIGTIIMGRRWSIVEEAYIIGQPTESIIEAAIDPVVEIYKDWLGGDEEIRMIRGRLLKRVTDVELAQFEAESEPVVKTALTKLFPYRQGLRIKPVWGKLRMKARAKLSEKIQASRKLGNLYVDPEGRYYTQEGKDYHPRGSIKIAREVAEELFEEAKSLIGEYQATEDQPLPLGDIDEETFFKQHPKLEWMEREGKQVLFKSGDPETSIAEIDPATGKADGDIDAMRESFMHRIRYGFAQEPKYKEIAEEFGGGPEPLLIGAEKASRGLAGVSGCSGYLAKIDNDSAYFMTNKHCGKGLAIGDEALVRTFYGVATGKVFYKDQMFDAMIVRVPLDRLLGARFMVPIPLAREQSPVGLDMSFYHQEGELIWQGGDKGVYVQTERGRGGYSGSPIINSFGQVIALGWGGTAKPFRWGDDIRRSAMVIPLAKLREVYKRAGLEEHLGGALMEEKEDESIEIQGRLMHPITYVQNAQLRAELVPMVQTALEDLFPYPQSLRLRPIWPKFQTVIIDRLNQRDLFKDLYSDEDGYIYTKQGKRYFIRQEGLEIAAEVAKEVVGPAEEAMQMQQATKAEPFPLGDIDQEEFFKGQPELRWAFLGGPKWSWQPGAAEEVEKLLQEGKQVLIKTDVLEATALAIADPETGEIEGDIDVMRKNFMHRMNYALSQEPQYREMVETFAGGPEPYMAAVEKASRGLAGIDYNCSGYLAKVDSELAYVVTARHCGGGLAVGDAISLDTFYGAASGTITYVDKEMDAMVVQIPLKRLPGIKFMIPLILAKEQSPVGLTISFECQEGELIWQHPTDEDVYLQTERGRSGYSGSPTINSLGQVIGLQVAGIHKWGGNVRGTSEIVTLKELRRIYKEAGLLEEPLGGALTSAVKLTEEGEALGEGRLDFMASQPKQIPVQGTTWIHVKGISKENKDLSLEELLKLPEGQDVLNLHADIRFDWFDKEPMLEGASIFLGTQKDIGKLLNYAGGKLGMTLKEKQPGAWNQPKEMHERSFPPGTVGNIAAKDTWGSMHLMDNVQLLPLRIRPQPKGERYFEFVLKFEKARHLDGVWAISEGAAEEYAPIPFMLFRLKELVPFAQRNAEKKAEEIATMQSWEARTEAQVRAFLGK